MAIQDLSEPAPTAPAPTHPTRHRVWAARTGLAITAVATLGPLLGHPLGSQATNIAVLTVSFGLLVWGGRQPGALDRRAVLATSAVLLTAAVVANPTFSRDVWSYSSYGRMVTHYHVSPFTHVPAQFHHDPITHLVAPVWRHTTSVYGPMWIALSIPGTALAGSSPLLNRLYFQALAALSVVAAMWIVDRNTGHEPLALALLGVNPFIIVMVVNGAHNDAVVGLAVLAAVVLAQRKSLRWCAVALAVAAAIKITVVLLAIALVVWVYRWQGRRAAATIAGWATAITTALVLGGGVGSFASLHKASEQMTSSSMWVLIRNMAPGVSWSHTVTSLGIACTLALAAVLVFRYRGRSHPAIVVGLAVLAYGAAAPYVYPWYLAWGIPALALCYRSRTTLMLIALAALLSLGLIPDPGAPGAALGMHVKGLGGGLLHHYARTGLPITRWCIVGAIVVWAALSPQVLGLMRSSRHPADPSPLPSGDAPR